MNSLEPKEEPQEEIPPFVRKLLSTDLRLRQGMGLLAVLFPIVLMAWGLLVGINIQPSMSHYYFASPSIFPLRASFVGGLFAIRCFLILYQGFSKRENFLLTLLGICALLVAIFHMTPDKCEVCGGPALPWWPKAHAVFAVLVFAAMAWIVLLCSRETFGALDENARKRYGLVYALIAVAMLLWPLIVLLIELFWPWGEFQWKILAIEVVGVVLFGIYWLIKTIEVSKFRSDKKAAMGELKRPPDPWPDSLSDPWRARLGRLLPTPYDKEEPVAWPSQQERLSQFINMIDVDGNSNLVDVAQSLMDPKKWQGGEIKKPTSENLQRCAKVLGECSKILNEQSLASASAGHVP